MQSNNIHCDLSLRFAPSNSQHYAEATWPPKRHLGFFWSPVYRPDATLALDDKGLNGYNMELLRPDSFCLSHRNEPGLRCSAQASSISSKTHLNEKIPWTYFTRIV